MRKASVVIASALLWAAIAALTVAVTAMQLAWVLVLGWADRQRRVPHWLSSLWGRSALALATAGRVTVRGRRHLPSGRPAILVANHQSLLDIMALYALRYHFKWVAKAELFRIPFLGWAMRASGYLALERGLHGSIRDTYGRARRCVARGIPLLLFPEGTRSRTDEMLPFKNGAFKLALETGAPIVPVAVRGTRELLGRGGWRFNVGRAVRITVLEPVDPSAYGPDGLQRLKDDVRQRLVEALHKDR